MTSQTTNKESINFYRLCSLLLDFGTNVLREFFDSHVPPHELESFLFSHKKKLSKNPAANWFAKKKLYPVDQKPTSRDFDIALLYLLSRETLDIDPPSTGWGHKPCPQDTSAGANIERLRQARNDLYGHAQHAVLSDEVFEKSWEELEKCLIELGGTKYKKDLEKLKCSPLDPENDLKSIIIELDRIVKKMHNETEKKKISHENINQNAQKNRIIETREYEDKKFVETRAYRAIEEQVFTRGSVLIMGDPGEGKTFSAWHLVLKCIHNGYELITINSLDDWWQAWNPGRKQIVFFDDCFGKSQGIPERAEMWRKLQDDLRGCINSPETYIIATTRRHIYKELKPHLIRFTLFGQCLDICNATFCLTPDERGKMFQTYARDKEDIETVTNVSKCCTPRFPLACRLYASDNSFRRQGIKLFQNPTSLLHDELLLLSRKEKIGFAALVLLMLNDGKMEQSAFTTESKDTIKSATTILDWLRYICCYNLSKTRDVNRFEEIKLSRKLSKSVTLRDFQNSLDKLLETYITFEDNRYVFVHESILETIGIILASEDLNFLLNNCSAYFLQQHVRVQALQQPMKSGLDYTITYIPDVHYRHLAERLTNDVIDKNIPAVFQNPSVCDVGFTACWCSYISGLGRTKQLQLMRSIDFNGFTIMYWAARSGNYFLLRYFLETHEPTSDTLHGACHSGNEELVRLVLSKHVETNCTDAGGMTPLLIACQMGYNKIVKLLISFGANVNQEQNNFGTPLHFSCWNSDIDLVQLLLKNGAQANTVCTAGWPYIYFSGEACNASVMQMLLKNGKDITLKSNTNWSPLHLACGLGNLDVVKLLLSYGADISKITTQGWSPLFCALVKGNTDVTKFLINLGADVNQGTNFGVLPLHRACLDGYSNIVNVLLHNGANVNAKSNAGYTPLHCACENGSVDIVQNLLQNGSDINIEGADRKKPIDVAKKKNRKSVVDLLTRNALLYPRSAAPNQFIKANTY